MAEVQKQEVTQITSNLPAYAQPYFMDIMNRAQAESKRQYQGYPFERIAEFTPAQEQIQQRYMGLQAPGQIATGSGLAEAAGRGSLAAADYAPTQFSAQQVGLPQLQQYRMQEPGMVTGGQYTSPQMQAAQTQFQPNLSYFQMEGPSSFTGQGTAQQYMSPYMQQVVDIQKQEAIRDAQQGQLGANLAAARQGTYGGARQALMQTERERNLGQQLGQIQASGQQAAFQQAQQQFNAEQAARQQAGQANLQARLGVQQLGTQTGLQAALANLDAASQANVQNMAAQLQTQGLNAQQALQAALANQQAQLTVGQQNLGAALGTQQLGTQVGMQGMLANQQAALEAQRLAEQSKQFGAQNQLQAFAQAAQSGQTMGNLGALQQQMDLSRLGAQTSAAAQQQALEQQRLDLDYSDFLRQRDYDWQQLGNYSNILRGLPVTPNATTTTYGQAPSTAAQLLGAGLGGLSYYNMAKGG